MDDRVKYKGGGYEIFMKDWRLYYFHPGTRVVCQIIIRYIYPEACTPFFFIIGGFLVSARHASVSMQFFYFF